MADAPTPCGACKIVILWEDFDRAIHARATFDRIVQTFGDGKPVEASWWSFRMLESPEFNAAVRTAASHAEVIVVAAHGDREISESVASRLESCATRGGGPPPVIVALHDHELAAEGEAAPLCALLQKIAARHRAGFACNRDIKASEVRRHPERRPRHEEHRTIQFQASAPASAFDNVRRFGIND